MAEQHKHIIPQLRSLAVAVDSLAFDPKNRRLHGDRNLETIKASLLRFGQRQPIIVQREGMIVRAGNGRLAAAREMGWEHIAAVVVDEPTKDAVAFALVDNRSAELAEWDYMGLFDDLDELAASSDDFDFEALGWTSAEFEALNLSKLWDTSTVPPPIDPSKQTKLILVIKAKGEARDTLMAAMVAAKAKFDLKDDAEALAKACSEWLAEA